MTDGYVYLCMTRNSWGSGKSEAEALANCKRQDYSAVRDAGYIIYEVHKDFTVDGINGNVYTPTGHPAIKVKDKRKGKRNG